MTEQDNRYKLGLVLSQWHASMGDPLYQVSSHLIANRLPTLSSVTEAEHEIGRMAVNSYLYADELRDLWKGLVQLKEYISTLNKEY